jgi:hypothetical protein
MGETFSVSHTVPVTQTVPAPPAHPRAGGWRRAVLVTAAVFAVAGVVGGWAWQQFSPLAQYTVGEDGATLDEEQMTRVFGPDGTFVSIGFCAALVLGGVIFWWLHERGPWSVPLVVAGSAVGSGIAWGVGMLLGHEDLDPRLAAARTGDVLTAPLELHAWSALAAWPVGAALAAAVIAAITWRHDQSAAHDPASPATARPDQTSDRTPWL